MHRNIFLLLITFSLMSSAVAQEHKTGILFQYRKSIPHGAKKCHHLFLTCLSSYCHPAQRIPVIFAILPVVVPRAFVV